ncbi:YciI family protein [Ursidibacter sp. B-7004-1]
MYIIDIVLDNSKIPAEQAENLLNQHRTWFAQYHQSGHFLMLGPYLDQQFAGVVIAQTQDRAELDRILQEDVYYPTQQAVYTVREFKAVMVADATPFKDR